MNILKAEELKLEKLDDIANNSDIFYYKDEYVKELDLNFRIYNYNLSDVDEFIKFGPLSFEMRGLTINLENPKLIFPSIHKIFNYKENILTTDYEFEDIEIREKLDGSLIQPIIYKDKIIFKTKGTFNSYQAELANKLLDDNLKKFILDMYYEYGYYPLFELVSPDNQIVVKYNDSKLVLIQLRNLWNLKYIPYYKLEQYANKYKIPYAKIQLLSNKSKNKLLELANTLIGIEGWVIQKTFNEKYTDFIKLKTKWYLDLHHIMSPDNLMPHKVIEMILNEEIDDVLSQLAENSPKRKEIEDIIHKIGYYIKTIYNDIIETIQNNKELFKNNPKAFVDLVNNKDYKQIIFKHIRKDYLNQDEIIDDIKKFIKLKTSKYENAKKFLEKI